jgi:hypothetical protein
MLNDSAGHRFCNRDGAIITFFGFPTTFPYDECELLYIDDLAVFFVQSIAYAKDAQGRVLHDEHGRPLPKALLPIDLPGYLEPFVDDDLMEGQAGIDGFRFHPTPQALARTLFLSPPPDFIADVMDPAVCKDGDRYQSQHSGSLAALELNGTYDQIRPLVQAFADHDAERLFVDVLVVLHSHWPSRNSLQHQGTNPGGHGYAKRSDIHAWEPLVARVLEEDALWSALTSGAATLNAIQLPSGRMAPEVLAAKARHVFGPQGWRSATARPPRPPRTAGRSPRSRPGTSSPMPTRPSEPSSPPPPARVSCGSAPAARCSTCWRAARPSARAGASATRASAARWPRSPISSGGASPRTGPPAISATGSAASFPETSSAS